MRWLLGLTLAGVTLMCSLSACVKGKPGEQCVRILDKMFEVGVADGKSPTLSAKARNVFMSQCMSLTDEQRECLRFSLELVQSPPDTITDKQKDCVLWSIDFLDSVNKQIEKESAK